MNTLLGVLLLVQ